MSDVVITIPKQLWAGWLEEGALPGEPDDGRLFYAQVHNAPRITPGGRVYVVAHGRLRGYAPLVSLDDTIPACCDLDETMEQWREEHVDGRHFYLVRAAGAVALTIDEEIRGFQGWRYRWWDRADERPFPDWQRP